MDYIDEIKLLVKNDILGREEMPEREYWHWPILKSEELPNRFKHDAISYGEVRWYGGKNG